MCGDDGFDNSNDAVDYNVQSDFAKVGDISAISRRIKAMHQCEVVVWDAIQKMMMNESNHGASIKVC
jgi:hypothetical protein